MNKGIAPLEPTDRPTIGLALGCGGWRGLAHIGVIKAFLEENIPIDFIAGTSAGSLIGGMYAALQDVEKIERFFRDLSYKDLLKAFSDPLARSGLVRGNKAIKLLQNYVGEVNIEDLDLPFTAVATDLLTAKTVNIRRGDLATAIRASASVPLMLAPLKADEMHLVDGAISLPIPVKTIKQMGAKITVAVNIINNVFPITNYRQRKNEPRAMSVLRISYQGLLTRLAFSNSKEADFVINPKIEEGNFDIFVKLVNNTQVIDDGYEAAKKIIPEIKKRIVQP